MRTAVMRVVVDADGVLAAEAYEAGLAELREALCEIRAEVVASPAAHLPDRGREIELILEESQLVERDEHVALCSKAFGLPASAGVVTFISRGTDADARGVLAAFGLDVPVVRELHGDDEVVRVLLDPEQRRRVPEGRLHTALEAALNCEVRIEAAVDSPSVAESAP